MPTAAKIRSPHWYGIPVRVLALAFFLTLLALAICLFLTILITVIVARLHGVHPDLHFAYRHYALPIAAGAGAVIFVVSTVMEIRYFRQSKALAGIARSSQS